MILVRTRVPDGPSAFEQESAPRMTAQVRKVESAAAAVTAANIAAYVWRPCATAI